MSDAGCGRCNTRPIQTECYSCNTKFVINAGICV